MLKRWLLEIVEFWDSVVLASFDAAKEAWHVNIFGIRMMRLLRRRKDRDVLYRAGVERAVAHRLELVRFVEAMEKEENEKNLSRYTQMVLDSPELRAEVLDVIDKQLAHWHKKLGIRDAGH